VTILVNNCLHFKRKRFIVQKQLAAENNITDRLAQKTLLFLRDI
jgi:hypothetical protein